MIQPRHGGGYSPQNKAATEVATLFLSDEGQPQRLVQQIKLTAIQPDDTQPRAQMTGIHELAESIRLEGLHQPIQVRRAYGARSPIEYTIIFGERRWRASSIAGNEYIDAIVIDIEGDTPQAIAEKTLERQVSENIQREDFSLADICRSIDRFKNEFKRTYKYIAENHFAPLSKGNEVWVGNRWRAWNNADFATRELMEKHNDVFSHVEVINSVVDEKLRAALVAATKDGGSVQTLRDMIAQAEHQSNHVATEPSKNASGTRSPPPTSTKVATIVAINAESIPQPTRADFEKLFDFPDEPSYNAQSVNNALLGIHSAMENIGRQIPLAVESKGFTELAREALATQLKSIEDEARKYRAILSRSI